MNPTWLYVAVVYGGAVAVARRARMDIPWRVAALFYILTLAWLFRPMTGAYVSIPTDVLGLVPPWSALAPASLTKYTVSNYELQDVVFQLAPWAQQVRESWLHLRVPLWNELAGCGYPLAANMQSQAFSPFRLLALPLPLGYALTAEAAMKILTAATFMFLWCRRRYDAMPSVIGAIAFAFGTFVITWLHFALASVAAFLPAVAYTIDLLAERVTARRIAGASLVAPALLFGGHPETAAHIVVFGAAYALWCGFVGTTVREKEEPRAESRPRYFAAIALVAILGAMLSAPLLLPFLEALPQTARYEQTRAEDHSGATAYSDLPSLTPLVQPRFFGARPGPTWGPATAESISGFAGILGIGAWLGLVVRAIVRRRFRDTEGFLIVATALTFVVLADVGPLSAPFKTLFALSLNYRLRLFFCFFAAAETAALIHFAREERSRLPLVAAIAGSCAALVFVTTRNHFSNADAKSYALAAMVPSLVVLAVSLILFSRRGALVTGAAIFAELWLTAHAWTPVRPLRELYPHTPLVDALLTARGHSEDRIAGIGGALFPNTNAVFGLADVRVHDPMESARYVNVLTTETHYTARDYYKKLTDADSPLLDSLGARWIATPKGVSVPRMRLVYDGFDGRVYENPRARPRFFSDNAAVRIDAAHSSKYELTVDAPQRALVESSIGWYPGWRATWNGRALEPVVTRGAFIGFVVPPGRGVVRVRYAPASFRLGVALAALAIAAQLLSFRAAKRAAARASRPL